METNRKKRQRDWRPTKLMIVKVTSPKGRCIKYVKSFNNKTGFSLSITYTKNMREACLLPRHQTKFIRIDCPRSAVERVPPLEQLVPASMSIEEIMENARKPIQGDSL